MVCVYVMLPPAVTGLGVPVLVTVRSHASTSGVFVVLLLFVRLGSVVTEDETEDVAVIGLVVSVAGTAKTTMMSAT